MKFDKVKNLAEAKKYLCEKIDSFEYVFDGYERVSPRLVQKDPLHRRFKEPRYNNKTRVFVTGLGGEEAAELVLLQAIEAADYFKWSPAHGIYQEDAFILKASVKGYATRLFIKVFNTIDVVNGDEVPVIVFHD